ncbi:MAG: hypothetical protein CMJ34_14010 [Phycisphaerae bacterium]|nr:hypothetical protein [Phycisphaerae bacterium]
MIGASSLKQVFTHRFVLGALVAPLGAWAAHRLASPTRWAWLAGALAGLLLAWDPGLVDTLVVSFRGYGAPEFIAVAMVGISVGGRAGAVVAGAAFVAATGQHPMSAGVGLGLAVLMWAQADRAALGFAVAAVALCALPRLHWIWQLGSCGAGFVECLGSVATGSAEPDVSAITMLRRAFWDRGVVELGLGASLAVLTGLVAAASHRHGRRLAWAGILAVLGVLALGLSIQGLRPYHLRAAMPVVVVAAAVGFSLRPWALGVAGLCLFFGGIRLEAPHGPAGDLAAVDALGAALAQGGEAVRVEAVWFEDPVGVEPAGVVLAARQAGLSTDLLTIEETAPLVLLVNGPASGELPVPLPATDGELDGIAREAVPGTRVVRFVGLAEARAWIQSASTPPVVSGGSFDWVKAMKPGVGAYEGL